MLFDCVDNIDIYNLLLIILYVKTLNVTFEKCKASSLNKIKLFILFFILFLMVVYLNFIDLNI